MKPKIILVFKTHFDIGFTDLAQNVTHAYGSSMLREVIETCRATEHMGPLRYKWTMPAWPLRYIIDHGDAFWNKKESKSWISLLSPICTEITLED